MSIEELIVEGCKTLHKDEVKLIISNYTTLNPLELYNHLNDEVDIEKTNKIIKAFRLLEEKKPLQYVLGKTSFYGYNFMVNENVLIPRFETEELVETTIDLIKKNFREDIKILDIGCGSGNIGITLKKELPASSVTLIDISEEALEVAKENAHQNNADVTFIKSNMLENVEDKYDVIISNPPYISYGEEIDPLVKENEPHLALFADNNGLYYYEQIIKEIQSHTTNKYLIAFEIGYKQKEEIINLINKYLKNIKIYTKKDLQERDRMIFIIKDE